MITVLKVVNGVGKVRWMVSTPADTFLYRREKDARTKAARLARKQLKSKWKKVEDV